MPIPNDKTVLLFVPIGPRTPILGIIIRSEVLEQDCKVLSSDGRGE